MTLLEAMRNALARIVAARSELESGDTTTADAILFDLEVDLAVLVDDDLRRAA